MSAHEASAGMHNAANALGGARARRSAGPADRPRCWRSSRDFPGLPHRSQWVADVSGVAYIERLRREPMSARRSRPLRACNGPLLLIAGGDGKNQDFAPLARRFRGKVRHAVLIGRDAPAIAARARRRLHAVERSATLEEAVRAAARRAARRHGAAVAGLREPRHVPRLCASRRCVRRAPCGGWRHERPLLIVRLLLPAGAAPPVSSIRCCCHAWCGS